MFDMPDLSTPRLCGIRLVPMVADQVLLRVANLSLLALPGIRSQRQLQTIALCDPLTGAWNRAALVAVARALQRVDLAMCRVKDAGRGRIAA